MFAWMRRVRASILFEPLQDARDLTRGLHPVFVADDGGGLDVQSLPLVRRCQASEQHEQGADATHVICIARHWARSSQRQRRNLSLSIQVLQEHLVEDAISEPVHLKRDARVRATLSAHLDRDVVAIRDLLEFDTGCRVGSANLDPGLRGRLSVADRGFARFDLGRARIRFIRPSWDSK